MKNIVVAFLKIIDGKPIVYYVKGEENIREMCLSCLLGNSVTFDNLKEYMINNVKLESKRFEGLSTIDEKYNLYLAKMNKTIDKYLEHMKVGSCSEGAINYECFEMTDEEFANPTGELMSPYAFECLDEGEEPKRNKYSFMNPVTGQITFIK